MSTQAVELRAQMMAALARAREINDLANTEARDFTDEEQVNYDTATADYIALQNRVKRQEYLESMPADDLERERFQLGQDALTPPTSEADAAERSKRAYKAAFRDYISAPNPRMLAQETWQVLYDQGQRPLDDAEKKVLARYSNAMSISSQAGGGFWVPDEMMQPIEKALLWYGGMRQFAEVLTTDTGADLPWPVYDDTGNTGRRLAENTAATQTDISVGVRVLKAHTYSSDEVLVSLQLLQDWPDQALGIIGDALGERIARAQNTDFTLNGAADGPQGLVPVVTSAFAAAATGAVTADELRRLKYTINRAYRDHPSSRYMVHDQTMRDVMGLVDGNGQYLFVPDPRQGAEPTIWGSPVVINNDVPTMATGTKSVIYGKGAAYKIREVRGFTLLRMDERYAPSLQVSFLGFARADGGYINAGQNPIQCITMA